MANSAKNKFFPSTVAHHGSLGIFKNRETSVLEQRLQEDLNFIQVVLGPRQVGKTTGLQQIVKSWPGQSLMISADELITPTTDWLRLNWERARNLGAGALN